MGPRHPTASTVARRPTELRRIQTNFERDHGEDGDFSSAASTASPFASEGLSDPGALHSARHGMVLHKARGTADSSGGSQGSSASSRFGSTPPAVTTGAAASVSQTGPGMAGSNGGVNGVLDSDSLRSPGAPGGSTSDYPYHSNLKARLPSPTLGRRLSASAAFPSSSPWPTPSRRHPLGLAGAGFPRRWRIALPRALLHRNRVLALTAAAFFLVLWLLMGRRKAVVPKTPLTTRWWDRQDTDDAPMLLPRPSMLPKPPKPKPPPLTSHTLTHLNRLRSTFSTASRPDWTAVIHLTSSSQLASLSSLIPSLQKQTYPPQHTLLLVPEGLHPELKPYGPSLGLVTYPPARPAALAIVLAASSIDTDFLLVVDADVEMVQPAYAKTLLRASGTKEYSSALLSAGGIVLPLSSGAPSRITCHAALDRTVALHAPTTPFLLQTTWLAPLSNGLRTDIPLELAISLALWTKAAIPSFGLPVFVEDSHHSIGCDRVARRLSLQDQAHLGPLFRADAGGSGLPGREGDQAVLKEGDTVITPEGTIVLLLAGDDELARAHALACGFAQTRSVRVYVTDSESTVHGPHVFFDGEERCHLDVHPLGTGAVTESLQLLIIEEFERLDKIELVVYVVDGDRGREFGEVMKWSGGVFGPWAGGVRRSKTRAEQLGGTIVVPLLAADIVHADWMSALPMEALRHWHTPKIDITIITNNRPASLFRLLTALQDAHYFGDEVSLSINLEQTADRLTHEIVDGLPWAFGSVTLRHRIVLGTLFPAVVESWYPTSNDSYGVFLEDDVEVSPFFYAWLKFTILQYRYYTPLRERSSRLFGISLYQQKNNELRLEGRRPFDAHALLDSLSLPPTLPYLSQVPCSWGAAYFPEIWREFHTYLALRLSEVSLPISDPIVPEVKSNKWPRSWKRYFIELVYMRGYVMLYPNYANFTSFSNNHMEKGAHIHVAEVDAKRKEQFNVPLMARNESILDLPDGRLPPWDALQITDLWGSLATDEDLVERGWQSVAQLDTCPPFRLDILPTYNARELLCPKSYTRTNVLVEAQPLAASIAGLGPRLPAKPPLAAEDDTFARPNLVDHPDGQHILPGDETPVVGVVDIDVVGVAAADSRAMGEAELAEQVVVEDNVKAVKLPHMDDLDDDDDEEEEEAAKREAEPPLRAREDLGNDGRWRFRPRR